MMRGPREGGGWPHRDRATADRIPCLNHRNGVATAGRGFDKRDQSLYGQAKPHRVRSI